MVTSAVVEVNGSRSAIDGTAAEFYADGDSEDTAAIATNWEDGERQRREPKENYNILNNQPVMITPAAAKVKGSGMHLNRTVADVGIKGVVEGDTTQQWITGGGGGGG